MNLGEIRLAFRFVGRQLALPPPPRIDHIGRQSQGRGSATVGVPISAFSFP